MEQLGKPRKNFELNGVLVYKYAKARTAKSGNNWLSAGFVFTDENGEKQTEKIDIPFNLVNPKVLERLSNRVSILDFPNHPIHCEAFRSEWQWKNEKGENRTFSKLVVVKEL